MADVLVRAADVHVAFGGIAALKGVDLEVRAGEVLGLVGANGAGKSTLMKVLAGAIPHGAYGGTVYRGGRPVAFRTPRDAEAAGIGLVPQEIVGVPHLSVIENILLERYPRRRGGWIDWVRARQEAAASLEAIGSTVPLDSPFDQISVAAQQMVQLARLIHGSADVVLFDEPTSSLAPPEVAILCDVIRRMRGEGRGVVLVTHRLGEIFEVCDRIQVFRDGKSVAVLDRGSAAPEAVVTAMLGRALAAIYPAPRPHPAGAPILEVRNASGIASGTSTAVHGVTFTLRRGEILGIFGLVGAGRTELLELLFGIRASLPGSSVRLDGVELRGRSTHQRVQAGLGFVTEDRKRTGLVLRMSVHGNILMASIDRFARRGLREPVREHRAVADLIVQLGVRTASPELSVQSLSGGNQQKVVLAKWLSNQPKVLLLDEPTRGIDVGAKAEVFRILSQLAENGLAILLVSSETAEITSFCDRALVMYRGAVVRELAGTAMTEAALLGAATGLAAA
jgi:ABC-type sugar transport system ATPase subunit